MSNITINGGVLDCYTPDSFPIKKFLEWEKKKTLNLSPEYQRSGVWSDKDRSRLIDTIFSGYPLPTVILYERIDTRTHKKVYDVIDGKQRLESILYFISALSGEKNGFLAKVSNRVDGEIETCKVRWRDLSYECQKQFLAYEIPCVIVQGAPSEIQEVFVRLNSTGKKLSNQEIRNAKYIHSPFLKAMRDLAKKLDKTFVRMGVLNENEICRMKDIEFVSELVISAINDCVSDKKKLLDQMMTTKGVDMRNVARASHSVTEAIHLVERILPDIRETRFRKLCDFYSLVTWFVLRYDTLAFADEESCALAGAYLRNFAVLADKAYEEIKHGKLGNNDSKVVAYIQSVREGGDAKSHRKERDNILSEVLKGIFEKKDARRLFTDVQRRIIWGTAKFHECCVCRTKLKWENFEIDHIKPHSKGGRTDLGNSALICRSCNSSKGNRR